MSKKSKLRLSLKAFPADGESLAFLGQLPTIFAQDHKLDVFAKRVDNRVRHVLEKAASTPPAGHGHKKAIVAADDFEVADQELIIQNY